MLPLLFNRRRSSPIDQADAPAGAFLRGLCCVLLLPVRLIGWHVAPVAFAVWWFCQWVKVAPAGDSPCSCLYAVYLRHNIAPAVSFAILPDALLSCWREI